MKKLFLVRFGSAPNPAVSQALMPHIVGKAFAAPIPGAILSVFNTQSSEETNLVNRYKVAIDYLLS